MPDLPIRSSVVLRKGHAVIIKSLADTDADLPFFVYGTLMRGQCREHAWPCKPIFNEPAMVQGDLYHLRSFPALISGMDAVVGELWSFHREDFVETVQRIDGVERYQQGADDYYERRVVTCLTSKHQELAAYAYFFLRLRDFPNSNRLRHYMLGRCQWKTL